MAPVDLVKPTDFAILEAMSDGRRHDAPNLTAYVDARSEYIVDRLISLRHQGLVRKAGPEPRTAMYELAPLGEVALEMRDSYEKRRSVEWGEEVRARLAERQQDS